MSEKLIDKSCLLEKFPGKGGWTYAALPDIGIGRSTPFGWIKVKGTIDGIEIRQYHLMPMGNGNLFLPVKTEIRKKINKQAGDWVHVCLQADTDPAEIPEEFTECLMMEPDAFRYFSSLTESEKHQYVRWVYSAKTEETRADRIAEVIGRLIKNKRFYDRL
ncbi:MAG: YdeI/OmpD-associated family protein [Bacteroidetes bacterium]|nr:YdeI/OmpD-associated family protein [Bacteroidota bacterium]